MRRRVFRAISGGRGLVSRQVFREKISDYHNLAQCGHQLMEACVGGGRLGKKCYCACATVSTLLYNLAVIPHKPTLFNFFNFASFWAEECCSFSKLDDSLLTWWWKNKPFIFLLHVVKVRPIFKFCWPYMQSVREQFKKHSGCYFEKILTVSKIAGLKICWKIAG